MTRKVLVVSVLLMVVATTVLSTPHHRDDDEDEDSGAVCRCSPDQWQGKQSLTYFASNQGKITMSQWEMDTTYDATNKREVSAVTATDSMGNVKRFVLLALYDKNIQYNYDLDTGKCTATFTGAFTGRCIPAGAQVVDPSLTLGAGDNKVSGFQVRHIYPNNVVAHLTVTTECVPILSTSRLINIYGITMASALFKDMTEGIEDESVFDIPSNCENIAAKAGHNDQDFEIYRSLRHSQ